MSAEEFSISFGNYAAENDIVMVLPQAASCFMGDVPGDDAAALNQVSRDGGMMTFMKGIYEKATTSDTSSRDADMATGAYEFRTAYPGMYDEEAAKSVFYSLFAMSLLAI